MPKRSLTAFLTNVERTKADYEKARKDLVRGLRGIGIEVSRRGRPPGTKSRKPRRRTAKPKG